MSQPTPSSKKSLGAIAQRLTIRNKYIRSLVLGVAGIMLVAVMGTTYAYATTPAEIRTPAYEHFHFRMQVIVKGKAVNFASKAFQEGYSKDNCNADITKSPIHFHDDKDQFVHIHWQGLSGGDVLKYYGWNHTGGTDGLMGYRFDQFPNLQTVATHGNSLPKVADTQKFYLYVGDEQGYQQHTFDDFITQDLEAFFGKQSTVGNAEELSLLERLLPTAAAHEAEAETTAASSDEDLERINNLLGNVVIFAQDQKPTEQHIKARFADLEPLSESTCSG